jgi:hypothetical protein
MKTLPRTLTIVVFAAIGLVLTLSFHAVAQTPKPTPDPNAPFILTIKTVATLKDGSTQGKENFRQTLKTYGKKGYHVTMINENNQREDLDDGPHKGAQSKLDIKTDKVTTSEIAKSASDGDLTLIQAHVTQLIATPTAADMAKVLAALN